MVVSVSAAVDVVILVVGVVALWGGAQLLVGSSVRLARRLGLSDLLIGVTVVAVGTSSPEIVVTLRAALAGAGDLAVGNVVGSNVFNLAVVLGVVAVVGSFPVERRIVHRDGVALLSATGAAALAVSDLRIIPLEGAVLLAGLAAYTVVSIRAGRTPDTEADPATAATPAGDRVGSPLASAPVDLSTPARRLATGPGRDGVLLLLGLAVVLIGGDLLVGAAVDIARTAGVSEWVIGGTVVAAGTSTPEFAVSLVAVRQGSLGVSVGNVVGSSVFNVLGVLGLASLLTPLTVGSEALSSVAWLVGLTVLVVAALWSGRRLSRVEGVALAMSEAVRWAVSLLRVFA
ncbi:sodium:calcium antiporter [Halobaculum marinum]|uniref:Sodium:calcium antiporter n=1 Tax=Halobaculum marinum TaxID=3031996 RepID=A0ABD5WX61_9EURY|nr:sodium:calcium antiporter [Halobaculum sp. DT55]